MFIYSLSDGVRQPSPHSPMLKGSETEANASHMSMSPQSLRRSKEEAFHSRNSSGSSVSGKTPPQRPPPPSPAALSKVNSHLSSVDVVLLADLFVQYIFNY